jgi:hypothetical protein
MKRLGLKQDWELVLSIQIKDAAEIATKVKENQRNVYPNKLVYLLDK